ncbi:SMI1/KNR4 family protein [Chishuiella sp.]|uniref:SMI1/KNR4 family protein n=1 Tax=Chishuiella sp. TaxID=1969467 RepID=UPI0028A9C1F7|nr:SMI1/KNR4 family protein [Chishuiella sp.]
MNTISKKYIEGLKKAYYENNSSEIWNYFEKVKHGASLENREKLKNLYPYIPESLLNILEYIDGTYFTEYEGEKITFYFLGSDIYEYPYYLLSSLEMIESKNKIIGYYADYIERKYDEVIIDDKITNSIENIKWLHFSDCMNNGGTSQLFIDFTPSENGTKGQIVRFLHDPDEFKVIADSFDEYLEKLIENEYDFIIEEMLE